MFRSTPKIEPEFKTARWVKKFALWPKEVLVACSEDGFHKSKYTQWVWLAPYFEYQSLSHKLPWAGNPSRYIKTPHGVMFAYDIRFAARLTNKDGVLINDIKLDCNGAEL